MGLWITSCRSLVTALLEHLDQENHFYANYALKLHQNSRIILDSFTPSLFLKLFQYNSHIPSFSLFHQSSDCEFAPVYSSSHAQASARQCFIFHQWNEQPVQRYTFPNCRYEHVCYNCAFDSSVRDIHHKAIFCPNTPAQQLVPLLRPRPLFQWNRLWLMQH